MRTAFAVGALCAALATSAAVAASAGWDVSGTWRGDVGDLTLAQSSGGALSGTFRMKIGCTEEYRVTGSIAGTAVKLALVRASGAGDAPPCAGTQSLNGSLAADGKSMSLALVNPFRSSPATTYVGSARPVGEPAPPPPAPAPPPTQKTYAPSIACSGRSQLCSPAWTATIGVPSAPLAMRFTAALAHCADVRIRIAVDGRDERVSGWLARGQSGPLWTWKVAAGPHRVALRAEGRKGGCNKGWLVSWSGKLLVRTG